MRFPRLQQTVPIVDQYGRPTPAFHIWWDRIATQLENQINNINSSLEALSLERMSDIVPVTITADYTGVVDPSSQLPKTIACTRLNGTTDVTTSSTWSVNVRSGSISCSIGSGTGVITVTAISSDAVVDVSSDRTVNGSTITLTKPLTVYFDKAEPPISGGTGGGGGGSGGTTMTDTTFNSISATTMAAISDVLTVTVGSGGRVDLSAPLSVTCSGASPTGTFDVYGIWQWDSTGGGVWTDLGTETLNQQSTLVNSAHEVDNGTLSVNIAKTGLAAASTQKFRLMARKSSGTKVMSFTGRATAAGS